MTPHGGERAPLALTFDDGPDPEWTPRVLELLAAAQATATFFVLGVRLREAPQLAEQILAGGHAIGLHGDGHLDHAVTAPAALAADTAAALATLRDCGVQPTLWRLPWGRSGVSTPAFAAEHRLHVVGWDADTHDWRGDGWVAQPGEVRSCAERGGVVLLHDAIGPGATRSSCANTLEIAGALLALAADAGTPVRALDPRPVSA